MPWSYPPEVKAKARRLVEKTALTCAEIGERVGVPGPTVSGWKRTERWTRPKAAFARRRSMPKSHRAAAARMMAAGASHRDVALVMGYHPDVLRRIGAEQRAAAKPGPEPVPAHVAALYDAWTSGEVDRDAFFRHAQQALAFVAAQAMIGRDPHANRKAQAIARAAVTIIKLPDGKPAPGASRHDHAYAGPQTYDETNALIEELAQRLAEFGVLREDGGLPDEGVAGAETLPQ